MPISLLHFLILLFFLLEVMIFIIYSKYIWNKIETLLFDRNSMITILFKICAIGAIV